jgi:hypothetical protein
MEYISGAWKGNYYTPTPALGTVGCATSFDLNNALEAGMIFLIFLVRKCRLGGGDLLIIPELFRF